MGQGAVQRWVGSGDGLCPTDHKDVIKECVPLPQEAASPFLSLSTKPRADSDDQK